MPSTDSPSRPDADGAADAPDLLRSRAYLRLLLLAAVIGLPISALAYGFLSLVHLIQDWVYDDVPRGFGFGETPSWWPLPVLAIAGVLVALIIRYLPGGGGHSPAQGFHAGPPPVPRELPGVILAALVGLGLGVDLGPEAPLIAMGGGLAVLALGRSAANRPRPAVAMVAATGSFAGVATLLGSPIVGAFLLMEAIGIAGPLLGTVLVPGLLAAGIGSLIFVGLGAWTGLGPLSLEVPNLPAVSSPTVGQLCWAVGIGVAGAFLGTGIRRAALWLEPIAAAHPMLVTPMMGVVIAALAIIYAELSDHPYSEVLYSGQTALGPLLTQSGTYTVWALLLLALCKSLAYGAALGSFRGGPVFPAMFIGGAGGLALSHLPGLPALAGASMGICAMCVAMLRLPLTSVLITALFLGTDGVRLMPVIIVAGVVSYVGIAWLNKPHQDPRDHEPAVVKPA